MRRKRLADGLERSGLLSLALGLRRRTRSPWLPVLTYHRFASPGSAGVLDDGVVDATPETFERQMSLLRRWFNVLPLDDLFAFRAGKPLPPNPVVVTFDDGYKDGFDVALPILARHGIRATFFVATDYIEQRKLFWWDRIHLVVKSCRREVLELSYPAPLRFVLQSTAERLAAATGLMRIVKDTQGLELERFLDHVSGACGSPVGQEEERRMADGLLMTWADLRGLRDAGMSVQSHTRSHRTLHTVPLAELASELGGSREILEQQLGERVRTIAYPVGKRLGKAPEVRASIRAAGYELGVTSGTGVNDIWTFDPLEARRLSVDTSLSSSQFLAMLAIPGFAY